MSLSKVGSLNPMFGKEKSDQFVKHMFKDRSGVNNPQYGTKKSADTLDKLRKKVYVYDKNKILIHSYAGIVIASKEIHISSQTINKYIDTEKMYKNYFFRRGAPH
jgi:group I intron endonuclease